MQITPKQWRLIKQISMAKAAEMVGVGGKNPGRTWQRWETGEAAAPLDVVSKITSLSDGAVSLESWRHVRAAHLNAGSSPSLESTARHEPAASHDPIPEISESPAAASGVGGRVVTLPP